MILKEYSNKKISQKLELDLIYFTDEIYNYIINLDDSSGLRYYE